MKATTLLPAILFACLVSALPHPAAPNGMGAEGDAGAAANGTANGTASEAAHGAANPGQAAAGALDLGSCKNAALAFGVGFDGRKEASFEPDDQATFKHGSAQSMFSFQPPASSNVVANARA